MVYLVFRCLVDLEKSIDRDTGPMPFCWSNRDILRYKNHVVDLWTNKLQTRSDVSQVEGRDQNQVQFFCLIVCPQQAERL